MISMLKKKKLVVIFTLCIALASCALFMGPQASIISALFEKFVGVDPLSAEIFEHPAIKKRMQKLLGDKYESTIALLNTASEIQKEGPLYYVISRYTPVPEFAEKAGFVFNSETNQMVVLLLKGDTSSLLFEVADKAKEKITPTLPKEMQLLLNPEKAAEQLIDNAIDNAKDKALDATGIDKALIDSIKKEN
jgi:hypothetical protein